jgi:hypothetical protein
MCEDETGQASHSRPRQMRAAGPRWWSVNRVIMKKKKTNKQTNEQNQNDAKSKAGSFFFKGSCHDAEKQAAQVSE